MGTDTLLQIFVAFGAGVFGTAYGGITAFVICGIVGLIGIAATYVGGPQYSNIITVAFGNWVGPHITFTAGVIAAAYAKKRGHLDDNPLGAKDVLTPLIKFNDWTVLAVGGISGILLMAFYELCRAIKLPTDLLALTIVAGCIAGRLIFSRTGLFGTLDDSLKEKASAANLWGRWLASEKTLVWLPWQRGWIDNIILSFGFGLGSAAATAVTGSALIGWCITAIGLCALMTDRGGPVAHHIALPAAYGYLATQSIVLGGLFGIVGGLVCEFFARVFHNHGDTHIDGPSSSIVVTTTMFMVLFPQIFK